MEHLLQKSECSIFHNIFKYVIFQRRQKAIMWSKGLILLHCMCNIHVIIEDMVSLVFQEMNIILIGDVAKGLAHAN